ncbi:MAG: recombination mediator RecR [Desulfobacterales bacterium]
MNQYPVSVVNLIQHLAKLPGIGTKTAERLALHLLRTSKDEVAQLARSMIQVKEKVQLCSRCYGMSDDDLCRICRNPNRDQGVLCVVEHPTDMAAIEKSGAFKGLYHILQGALAPMDGIGPEDIRIGELMARIASDDICEIIIATGTSVEGESTAAYLSERLKSHPLKVSRIASGVPVGGDLKYIDQITLKRAMECRHEF